MKNNSVKNITLTPIDDIFKVDSDGESAGKITEIPLDKLRPFKAHPFKLYDGERFADMVASIKDNGVIIPIIVRKTDDSEYEILSGHNRVQAAKAAGLEVIPAIIRDGLTDDAALLIVTETNIIQRSFVDLSHSERAVILATRHEAIKKQGSRTDLIQDIENMINASNIAGYKTSGTVCQKSDSRTTISNSYDISNRSVANYLRINKLLQSHKNRLDNGDLSVRAAVALSYLSESEQQVVDDILCANNYKVDIKKAESLRSASEKKSFARETAEQILSGKKKISHQKLSAFKITPKILSKYFKPNDKSDAIESVIVQALELYYSQRL